MAAKKTGTRRGSRDKQKAWHTEAKLKLLTAWARQGMTDEAIAKNIGISRSTLSEWKNRYPDISDALNTGAREADAVVENSLFEQTIGKTVTLKRPQKLREKVYDESGKLVGETERIEMVDFQEYVPANVTATIFWLKNRLPDLWRDKVSTEIGGSIDAVEKLSQEDRELFEKAVKRLESYPAESV
ncbi:MAG: helix-turn-helix domain-containing protein [Clostridia bacterium]|nr:helix-turn-helix domain-containing protein [Clostridia bacterium]